MAIIKCSECKKEVSNNAKRCINCGNYLEKGNDKMIPEKSNFKEKMFIISFMYLIVAYVLFTCLPLVSNDNYGTYSFTNMLARMFHLGSSTIFNVLILFYLLLMSLFISFKKNALNILAKIGYILELIVTVVAILAMGAASEFDLRLLFYLIPVINLIYIIYVFKNNKSTPREVKVVNHNVIEKETIIKESNSKADELIKLKKLLDDEIITKEEFDKLKKDLIKKED